MEDIKGFRHIKTGIYEACLIYSKGEVEGFAWLRLTGPNGARLSMKTTLGSLAEEFYESEIDGDSLRSDPEFPDSESTLKLGDRNGKAVLLRLIPLAEFYRIDFRADLADLVNGIS